MEEIYMKKTLSRCLALLPLAFAASGCGMVGNKSAGYTFAYVVTALISLGILIGYCLMTKKKDKWLLLLFGSVLTVNIGYLWLAVSSTVNAALWANRLSYLGSVVLPLSMLMIILESANLRYKKQLPIFLFALCAVRSAACPPPSALALQGMEEVHSGFLIWSRP